MEAFPTAIDVADLVTTQPADTLPRFRIPASWRDRHPAG